MNERERERERVSVLGEAKGCDTFNKYITQKVKIPREGRRNRSSGRKRSRAHPVEA